jgi:hypothetical protein
LSHGLLQGGTMAHTPIDRAIARSFIVRIYRALPNQPKCLLGRVEEVGKNSTRVFKNIEELWEILNRSSDKNQKKSSNKRPATLRNNP